ncbi:hypothetical protein ACWC1D_15510 [Streptomyces sp. NPDC001478]
MRGSEEVGRSAARAHLSQLIGMFGVDGCLRIGVVRDADEETSRWDAEDDGGDEQWSGMGGWDGLD